MLLPERQRELIVTKVAGGVFGVRKIRIYSLPIILVASELSEDRLAV